MTHHAVIPIDKPVSPKARPSLLLPTDLNLPNATQVSAPNPSSNLILLADKACNVTGLLHPPHRSKRADTKAIFEAHLPRSITRLQRGAIRPPWRLPLVGHRSGVLVDDIIGSCSDGTVYAFSIIDEPALRLLRYIQRLIELKSKELVIVKSVQDSLQGNATEVAAAWSSLLGSGDHGWEVASESCDKLAESDVSLSISVGDVDELSGSKTAPKLWSVDGDVIARYFAEEASSFAERAKREDEIGRAHV